MNMGKIASGILCFFFFSSQLIFRVTITTAIHLSYRKISKLKRAPQRDYKGQNYSLSEKKKINYLVMSIVLVLSKVS